MPDKSKVTTELYLLASLKQGEVVTQASLSKRIAVSVGLVNGLVKRAIDKGYVTVKAGRKKRYAYFLTPKGFAEKSRLMSDYLETSLSFYRQARQEYSGLFSRARASGIKRIAFVGGSDLAEIALIAAHEVGIEAEFVFDQATNKDRQCGLPVAREPAALASVDWIAITDMRAPQQAFDHMLEHFADWQIMAPQLLRITRARPAFVPKVEPS